MECRSTATLCLLLGLLCCAQTGRAMPKAAENEEAQVSRGADVARPKASAKPAKAQAGHRAGAKTKRAGAANPPRGAKAQHGSSRVMPSTLC